MIMEINDILIEEDVQEKILGHGLQREDVENGLHFGNPKFSKDRFGRYLAITHYNRYVTVIFEYKDSNAHIITAYPSADWQVKKYKRK